MRSVESEGESIDEAIENALKTLQVQRDQVEIAILTDATRGLFGFGRKRARVRATVRAPLAARLHDIDESKKDSRETSAAVAPPSPAENRRPTTTGTPAVSAASVGRSRAILMELLTHLGVSARVESRSGEDPSMIVLEVNGDSGGLLIG